MIFYDNVSASPQVSLVLNFVLCFLIFQFISIHSVLSNNYIERLLLFLAYNLQFQKFIH